MKINHINSASCESQEMNLLQLLEDSLVANHDSILVKQIVRTAKPHTI